MKKEFRSICFAWVAVIAFAVTVLSGTAIGPVVYTFSDGGVVHAFDCFVAIPAIVALEFTVRKLRKIKENESNNLESESNKVFVNSYSSGTKEFVNVETRPMNIIAE